MKNILKNPEYAEMRHDDVILTLQLWRHGSTFGQRENPNRYDPYSKAIDHFFVMLRLSFQQISLS